MNAKCPTIAALAAVMLVAATAALVTTGNAFAYEKSQAVSQVNDCGNGGAHGGHGPMVTTEPIEGGAENVGCQNTASQIQGDDNSAALASSQEFDD